MTLSRRNAPRRNARACSSGRLRTLAMPSSNDAPAGQPEALHTTVQRCCTLPIARQWRCLLAGSRASPGQSAADGMTHVASRSATTEGMSAPPPPLPPGSGGWTSDVGRTWRGRLKMDHMKPS
eukprot:scaffold8853_cov103-Isochrysis_galbana.AAC.4